VKEWHKICRKQKHATTMLGARRHLHGRKHYGNGDEFLRSAADRLAYSMRIQGSSAEITKLVEGRCYRELGSEVPMNLRFFGMVHDELLFYVRKAKISTLVPKIKEFMSQPYADMIIPMETSPEIGDSWGKLSDWEG